jgi:hypothetical protein
MRKKLVLIVLILILGLAATLHLYFIENTSGASLFWNANKAYLFLEGSRTGYRVSYLRFPLVIAEQYLGGVPTRDTWKPYVVVVEITPEHVERFVFDNTTFSLTGSGPMGQFIYGGSGKGLVRWTGSGFQAATPEEAREIRTMNLPFNYDDLNGWSARGGLPDDGNVVVTLAGKQVTLVSRSSGKWGLDVSIDLLRPGQAPERLWNGGDRRQRVSKTQYYQTFGKR